VNYALSFLTYFCPEDGGDLLLRNIGACRGYMSLIECSSTGTTKKLPFGVNTTIELKKYNNYMQQYRRITSSKHTPLDATIVECSYIFLSTIVV
jgi:hypothetical protein